MAIHRLRGQGPNRNRRADKEREERWEQLAKKQAAAEARLGEIAERVLSVPAHMINRAGDQAWESSIVDDSSMRAILSGWMDQLIIHDPSFLARVFERWRDVLKPLKEQGLSLDTTLTVDDPPE
jgi:hypothetical protein